MGDLTVKVSAGLRVGFWDPAAFYPKPAFKAVGFYNGPDLGDVVIGTKLRQTLDEGVLEFSVGVLFRPDLGSRQRCETILILHTWIPEMFLYVDWAATEDELTLHRV